MDASYIEARRQLRDRLGALKYRAELLTDTCGALPLVGDVLSPAWWRGFGERFGVKIPAELTK